MPVISIKIIGVNVAQIGIIALFSGIKMTPFPRFSLFFSLLDGSY